MTGGAQSNDPVPFVDVTNMGTSTSKIGSTIGMAALVMAAGLASPAISSAEPEAHKVVYTVTSANPYDFDLYYLTAQPPSKAAYNADAYSYMKNEKVSLAPGVPWTFETTLADPQWAILTVSSTTKGTVGAPDAQCDISVDGQSLAHQDHPYSPRCQLGQW